MSSSIKFENGKSGKSKIKSFLTSTGFLTNGFFLIGGIIILGGFALVNAIYKQNPPDLYLGIIIATGIPWLILGCVSVILRKEVPRWGMPNITGKFAVLQGVLGLAVFSISEVFILYLIFNSR